MFELGIQFYPTPENVIDKMLSGIDLRKIATILEPSAGKGDILRKIAFRENAFELHSFDVDCIEIDPNLRQILKYNFGGRLKELKAKGREIEEKEHCQLRCGEVTRWNQITRSYEPVEPELAERVKEIDFEKKHFFENGIHIIHDDFLTFEPFKEYDLIIMNPPFANGDIHLLKALDIQKRGGNIVCLLNAETIKNPFSETRKILNDKLAEYNASIEFVQHAFCDAERKTDVEIAIIKVSIPKEQKESDIYNRLKKAAEYEEQPVIANELEVTDYIKAAVNLFNVEVKSGIELINQYKAMIPYMACSFESNTGPILRLSDNHGHSVSVNRYLKGVRLKYWRALLSNEKFTGKLTSKLQSEYREKVEKLSDYDFTEFNIYTLSAEMNSQIKSGIEAEITAMFERLTEEHAWFPEMQKNRHYFDGWCTNQAHKIGKKVIIPVYGVFDSWDGSPRVYNATGVLTDIEKILNYFDGHMTAEVDLWRTIEQYFNSGITKKIPLKFFNATFYKKGTVHLEFTCPELIERFNIYYARGKQWLPPTYGKKHYSDMTAAEKQVIDSFQGEKEYEEVIKNSGYYLAPVVENNLLLIE